MARFWRALAVLSLVFAPLGLWGQSKTFYIANDDHTDFMWSANEANYHAAFLQMIDYYLGLADATSSESPDFQSRFNCDGSYWVRIYEKNKSNAEFLRLISRIKSGHISVPVTLLNLCYGGMPAEAVIRSMFYAGSLARRYGLKFKLALAQENQAMPFGVGSLFAGAGASYFWKGICGCASKIPDAWDRIRDMYWWTGKDGSRLLTKWYSQIRKDYYGIGGYAEARNLPGVILDAEANPNFLARVPYGIVGLFGYGGDNLSTKTDVFVNVAKQMTTATRRIVASNMVDFFDAFKSAYGASLPSLSASFGNEWDLLNASMAELSGMIKRGVEKLRSAEALAAIAAWKDPGFMIGREAARDQAWIDLGMYFEHDWTADGPISRSARAAWQRYRVSGFLRYVTDLYKAATAKLGRLINTGGQTGLYYVFNPSSWPRTDFADLPYAGTGAVHVMDMTTGEETPSQSVVQGTSRLLRIWAADVPSLGYKVFKVASGAGRSFGGGPAVSSGKLETGAYRVSVASNGAITSLIDKVRGGREFVKAIGGLRLNELGAGSGTLSIENAGPVSATLKAQSSAPLSHTTRITLFRDSDRVDIRNEITQNFSQVAQWNFCFNVSSPAVWHEEVGTEIKARPLSAGGQYAPRNLRRDWLTLNHFVDMANSSAGVTISSADNQFFKLGASTTSVLDTATPKIAVLAGGQVDGAGLGIPAQGGDSYFLQRFALRTHGAFSNPEAMRFAFEHQNPLVAGAVTGGGNLPGTQFSFLSTSDPDVIVWALKPAEDTSSGKTVVRIRHLADSVKTVSLLFGAGISGAKRVTHIEVSLADVSAGGNSFSTTIGRWMWQTFALSLSR